MTACPALHAGLCLASQGCPLADEVRQVIDRWNSLAFSEISVARIPPRPCLRVKYIHVAVLPTLDLLCYLLSRRLHLVRRCWTSSAADPSTSPARTSTGLLSFQAIKIFGTRARWLSALLGLRLCALSFDSALKRATAGAL
jgi:hypothetical protein